MSRALIRRNPLDEAELEKLGSYDIKSADNWSDFIKLAAKVGQDELMESNSATQASNLEKVIAGIIAGGQQSIYNKQSIDGLVSDEAPEAATGKMMKINHFENFARILDAYGATKTAKAVRKTGKTFTRNWPLIIGLSVGGVGLIGLGVWYFWLREEA